MNLKIPEGMRVSQYFPQVMVIILEQGQFKLLVKDSCNAPFAMLKGAPIAAYIDMMLVEDNTNIFSRLEIYTPVYDAPMGVVSQTLTHMFFKTLQLASHAGFTNLYYDNQDNMMIRSRFNVASSDVQQQLKNEAEIIEEILKHINNIAGLLAKTLN